jgi:hypothetical protein
MCSNQAATEAHTKFQQIEDNPFRSEFRFAQTNSRWNLTRGRVLNYSNKMKRLVLSCAALLSLPPAEAWLTPVAHSPPPPPRRVVLSGSSRREGSDRLSSPKSRTRPARGREGWWMPPTTEPKPPSLGQKMLVRIRKPYF